MPSPFPGMNPYLENPLVWQDFHQSYCYLIREALVPQVQPDYYVRLDEHLYVHDTIDDLRWPLGKPDVALSRDLKIASSVAATALLESPAEGLLPEEVEETRSSFLEIRSRADDEVVTILEMLSPANKQPGKDRDQFLAKRWQILGSPVHYVEIDLLRVGARLPPEQQPTCDYRVLVSRSERRPRVGLWPLGLRDPLPTIPVPLRSPDREARLDLQAILHRAFDAAGYAAYLYRHEPQPRLGADDEAWAKTCLPSTTLA